MPILRKLTHHSHKEHHGHHHKEHHHKEHHEDRGKSGHNAAPGQMQGIQEFNQTQPYLQGNRITFTGGSNPATTIQLLNPGKFLYGIQVLPATSSLDLSDVAVTFTLNNNNVLVTISAVVLNPTKLLGYLYYPTPQPLIGTDNIQVTLNSQGAAVSGALYFQMYYIPRR